MSTYRTITGSMLRATRAMVHSASDEDVKRTWAQCTARFSLGQADGIDVIARIILRQEIVERTHLWHGWSDFQGEE